MMIPYCPAAALSPATGDPVVTILAVLGISAVAMVVLTVLSKRRGGGTRTPFSLRVHCAGVNL